MHLPERYVPGIAVFPWSGYVRPQNNIKHRHNHDHEAQECFVILVLLVLVVEL